MKLMISELPQCYTQTGKDIKDVLSHIVVGNESSGEDYELQYEVHIYRDFYDYLHYEGSS